MYILITCLQFLTLQQFSNSGEWNIVAGHMKPGGQSPEQVAQRGCQISLLANAQNLVG